ncbi:MAG: N-methyl-L-tryptophan oxidase [Gemmataceae bacterium]|nr:N-methyl-L-tryptophan oxidase [Gemmataceae bacterium]
MDVIVIGLGGMGTAAAWRLAQRGARVLAFDQFPLGHALGSSHGHSRIIRQAYYEHPAYVPLVRRAWEGWNELDPSLLTPAPCLSLGPPGSPLVEGVRESARTHGLEVEDLTAEVVVRRWPAFRLDAGFDAVLERSAGILAVDRCVRAMADEARRLGADLREERVLGWDGGSVRTERGAYRAPRLVVAAGPWAKALLPHLPLTVMRQTAQWFAGEAGIPVFIAEAAGGFFYGLPAHEGRGVKVSQHYGAPELPGPEGVERTVTEADETPVREFLRRHLPGVGARTDGSVCLYTLTPDRHFVIDRVGEAAVAAGFSGHGFKFAPVVGEILADLALEGGTRWPIGLFAAGRFGG